MQAPANEMQQNELSKETRDKFDLIHRKNAVDWQEGQRLINALPEDEQALYHTYKFTKQANANVPTTRVLGLGIKPPPGFIEADYQGGVRRKTTKRRKSNKRRKSKKRRKSMRRR
jgi:hypothetical protein